MTARSKGHHEIPKWLLKHFCWDKGKTLWMGSKDTREVKAVVLKDAFRRNDANTRIDYQSRGCGKPRRIKSDLDEKILGKFDDKADRAACRLSNTLEADSCVDALEEALSRDLPGVFNTDQGSQFTSEALTSRVKRRRSRSWASGPGLKSMLTTRSSGLSLAGVFGLF